MAATETRQSANRGVSFPDRVGQLYYSHGVFCASHPTLVLTVTLVIVLACCWPLVTLPLPGNAPQEFSVPWQDLPEVYESHQQTPWWFRGPPVAYVLQVVVKSAVLPWTDALIPTDAFRGPISEAFKLREILVNYQLPDSSLLLDDMCYRVDQVHPKTLSGILPEYNCLVLSPANFWGQNMMRFHDDPSVLATVVSHQAKPHAHGSLAELFLGMPLRETGFHRYSSQNQSKPVFYALTIVMRELHRPFLDGLRTRLESYYRPWQWNGTALNDDKLNWKIQHVHFPAQMSLLELIPLSVTYCILFLYIYFSVRKMELVKSKVGMAFSALFTVVASLCMSVGTCTAFGLSFATNGREIFPYLVVIVGLENVLVLTKSVVSTPAYLDAKIRVARGLSREGWSITKNLLTEVTILAVGFFTFVPAIQEFCVFVVVGLLSDFFLQTTFFATLLSIDIRGTEAADHHVARMPAKVTSPQKKISPSQWNDAPILVKIPKRLRLVYFWARTRIFQRALTVFLVVWISIMIYHSGIIDSLRMANEDDDVARIPGAHSYFAASQNLTNRSDARPFAEEDGSATRDVEDTFFRSANDVPPTLPLWMSSTHWIRLFSFYNVSLSGRYLSFVPPIWLWVPINPEMAVSVRHTDEEEMAKKINWRTVAGGKESQDLLSGSGSASKSTKGNFLYYHLSVTSATEFLLMAIFVIPSLIFIAYLISVLYRCICSRNYAEWRSSWSKANGSTQDSYIQVVMEALPISLEGHTQAVECLANDCNFIVSACLGGQLRVWDAQSGDAVASIDRKAYLTSPVPSNAPSPCGIDDGVMSDYESGSPPRNEVDLAGKMSNSADENWEYQEKTSGHSEEGCCKDLPVWCLDCKGGMIAVGCGNGKIEFWDAALGKLKCVHHDSRDTGVTAIKIVGNRVIVAYLDGVLEFLQLRSQIQDCQDEWNFASYRRNAAPVQNEFAPVGLENEIQCHWLHSAKAHQGPISCMDCEGEHVITGSQDHTLKVFRLEDHTMLYVLHGHCGPISCLFVDKLSPTTAGSGSRDGTLCVWDLCTGTCVYSILAHDGSITGLTYSASYVISMGADEKLCVWERFQGHLLNTIHLNQSYCCNLVMLTFNLLITGKQGSLLVWDVRTGDPVRVVRLGRDDSSVFVRQMLLLEHTVVCDYGSELRLVHFPMVTQKND